MAEKPPAFVVVDKRKYTSEGAIREGFVEPEPPPPAAPAAPEEPARKAPTPSRSPQASTGATANATLPGNDLLDEDMDEEMERDMAGALEASGTGGLAFEPDGGDLDADDALAPAPSSAETAAQDAAYRQTSRELDSVLRQNNPGMQQPGAVAFEHLVQSFYLSAIMAMGAGTEAGQKPRIDILGARQAIDLLGVLEEKTRGNLSSQEQQLLQTITFELRMMFLELTNAISRQAQQPPPPGGLR